MVEILLRVTYYTGCVAVLLKQVYILEEIKLLRNLNFCDKMTSRIKGKEKKRKEKEQEEHYKTSVKTLSIYLLNYYSKQVI